MTGLDRIAALDQPVRRDLYRFLRSAEGGWSSRDEAAEALGVRRALAAFHLDKLVEAGVLETRFERRTGRSGPGAGRPAKLYRPVDAEVAASIPERHYDLAGSLLAAAVAESTRTGAPVADCLHAVAHDAGEAIGREARDAVEAGAGEDVEAAVLAVLGDHGYEPTPVGDGELALANCPFHRLAEQQRPLVCGMNLDFLAGLLEGFGATGTLGARLQPEPGWCCVRIATA